MARHRAWIGAAMLVLAAIVRVPSLDQPLLERQGFRQTQTAYTTLDYHEHGIDLLHPKLPVLGPPYEAPFEFPLFQAIASVPASFGVSVDASTRATNLFFFLLTALLLWGLVTSLAGRIAGLAALGAFLFSPFGMLWGRTSMIEYLVTAGSVGFAWAAIRWQRDRRLVDALLALAAGSVAMLVKPTTAVFWLLPVLAYRPPRARPGFVGWLRSRFEPILVGLVVVPVALGLLWTRHADAIKAAHATTNFITSKSLTNWNFGTLAQREHLHNWGRALASSGLLIAGPAVWLAVLHRRFHPPGQRFLWLAMVGATLLPVAVLFNLYVVHDYYSIAVSPQVAALFGVVVGGVWRLRSGRRWRQWVTTGVIVWLLVLLAVATPYWDVIYQRHPSRSVQPRALATELASHSRTSDGILISGLDWSPAVPYYARRRVLMIPHELVSQAILDRLPSQGYGVLLAPAPSNVTSYVLKLWPWSGSVSPHVYRMARGPADLAGLAVLSSSASPPPQATQLAAPVVVACDGKTAELPRGAGATWLRLLGDSHNVVRVTGSPAPLPLRPTIVVRTAASSRLRVSCAGIGAVTVTPFDGPLP